jgi:hypothetical protein
MAAGASLRDRFETGRRAASGELRLDERRGHEDPGVHEPSGWPVFLQLSEAIGVVVKEQVVSCRLRSKKFANLFAPFNRDRRAQANPCSRRPEGRATSCQAHGNRCNEHQDSHHLLRRRLPRLPDAARTDRAGLRRCREKCRPSPRIGAAEAPSATSGLRSMPAVTSPRSDVPGRRGRPTCPAPARTPRTHRARAAGSTRSPAPRRSPSRAAGGAAAPSRRLRRPP